MKERLIELISEVQYMGGLEEKLADHLLDNGVVVVDSRVVSPKNLPLITHIAGYPINEVIDLMEAKNAGRIVELPCAVGDDIYWINPSTNKVECAKNDIKAVCYFGDGDFKIICQGANKPEDIGTTWCFLTKEEAEKALERSEGK